MPPLNTALESKIMPAYITCIKITAKYDFFEPIDNDISLNLLDLCSGRSQRLVVVYIGTSMMRNDKNHK